MDGNDGQHDRARGGGHRAGRPGPARTLRDVLRAHPAGPEVTAALGPFADRAPPAGWGRWAPAEREHYLDAVLDAARAAGGRPTA